MLNIALISFSATFSARGKRQDAKGNRQHKVREHLSRKSNNYAYRGLLRAQNNHRYFASFAEQSAEQLTEIIGIGYDIN